MIEFNIAKPAIPNLEDIRRFLAWGQDNSQNADTRKKLESHSDAQGETL